MHKKSTAAAKTFEVGPKMIIRINTPTDIKPSEKTGMETEH